MLECAVLCVCLCVGVFVWAEGAELAVFKGDMAEIFPFYLKWLNQSQNSYNGLLFGKTFTGSLSGSDSVTETLSVTHTGPTGNVYSVCLKESDSYRPCTGKAKRSGRTIKHTTAPPLTVRV